MKHIYAMWKSTTSTVGQNWQLVIIFEYRYINFENNLHESFQDNYTIVNLQLVPSN